MYIRRVSTMDGQSIANDVTVAERSGVLRTVAHGTLIRPLALLDLLIKVLQIQSLT